MKINQFVNHNNKLRLSPTAISCFSECQRKFFYVYIRGIEVEPRPSMIRGKIAHKVLDDFFNYVNITDIKEKDWKVSWKKFNKVLSSLLETEWKQIGKEYEDCFKDEKQKKKFLDETKKFLDFYSLRLAFALSNKMDELNENSEWFERDLKRFFYPKDRELRLELDDENIAGVIDKTMSLFGKGIAIIDYKTSRCPLPHFIPESHLKQGKAYAYIWKQSFDELPRHISFHYLRTGESVYYPISENDIKEIKKDIDDIRNRKPVIHEFSKNESGLCKFCDFERLCKKKPQ